MKTGSFAYLLMPAFFVAGLSGLGVSGLSGASEYRSSAVNEKPNIIFIMADDLGYGQLGCYGQEKMQTPNIDKMASEGMRFTDFYSGSSVCAPSRCSLVTGKHPGHAYIRGNLEIGAWDSYLGQLPLPESETTVFDVVKGAGYSTGVYGKWGLGRAASSGSPENNGVDDFFGYNCQRQAHSYYPRYLEGNRGEKIWLENNRREDGGMYYSHDLIAEKALEFIRDHRDTPFLLYLPFTIPHGPMEVPGLGIYEDKDWGHRFVTESAMVTRMDSDVGRIFALLEELGIDEKTVVFFTSDNGPHGGGTVEFFEASGPLRGKKSDLYEGGIRVPMIARWPGKIEAGSVSNHVGAFWDMMPTFAELSGSNLPIERTDGISFLPELLGDPQVEHEYLYWEYHSTDYGWKPDMETNQLRFQNQAIRVGKWKAIRHNLVDNFENTPVEFSELELYNLEEDISESDDLASERPDVVGMLLGLMKACHVPTEHFKIRTN